MKVVFYLLLLFLAQGSSGQNNATVTQSFRQYVETRGNFVNGITSTTLIKEDTKGSPLLFPDWAKGTVYLTRNKVFTEPANALNFNKESGRLLYKVSDQQMVIVSPDDIEKVELHDNHNSYVFVPLPEDKSTFVIRLYQDSGYSLYKSITTKFRPADYVNKGQYESGYKYDRYEDKISYRIQKAGGEGYAVDNVTKKELNRISASIPAIKQFLKMDKSDPNDKDAYLIHLVQFLNTQRKL